MDYHMGLITEGGIILTFNDCYDDLECEILQGLNVYIIIGSGTIFHSKLSPPPAFLCQVQIRLGSVIDW